MSGWPAETDSEVNNATMVMRPSFGIWVFGELNILLDRSSDRGMGDADSMVEVETEMLWIGDLAKAEALLAAIDGDDSAEIKLVTEGDGGETGLRILVKGDDLREVRAQVDTLLAALSSAEAKYDSNN